ncbi:glutamate receptor ionotropic, delta-2-like [Palaemon carinicauda]|uniref:glutamate receptor ionotropic, delta-2-like n=1 Tax=Palaemon carinicauda TaxID=392227 RepID=UPI0035B666B9
MGPSLDEVLRDQDVVDEMLTNPSSFRFKIAPTLILTMVSWPTHTRLALEDMNSPTVLAGIPTNFPIGGPMSEVLKILTTTMNFTYLQVVPPDVSFGTPYPNGSWSGMIRMLLDKKADVGLGPFQVIHSRSRVVDYTHAICYDILSLMDVRGIGATNPWGFLMPFTPSLWTWIFVGLLFCTFSDTLLDFRGWGKKNVISRFGNALLDYSMAPMGQAMCGRIHGWRRPLVGFWVVVALMVNSMYDGSLRSLMSLRHVPHPIQTLQDAIKATDKKIIIEHRTSFTDIMSCGIRYRLMSLLLETFLMPLDWHPGPAFVLEPPESEFLSGDVRKLDDAGKAGRYVDLKMRDFMAYAHLVERGDHLQIFDFMTASRYIALYFSQKAKCSFYFSKEKFIPTMYAMTIRKNSPLQKPMNARVIRIMEAGLYDYWMRNGVGNFTACLNPPTKVPSQDPLEFSSIWGLAVIWAAGMSVAAVCLVLELIYYYLIRQENSPEYMEPKVEMMD